jgi:hypothetical protein
MRPSVRPEFNGVIWITFVNDMPWRPWDRTAGMSMPRNAIEAMTAAVDDSLMRDIVADHTTHKTALPTVPSQPSAPSGSGWVDQIPFKPR